MLFFLCVEGADLGVGMGGGGHGVNIFFSSAVPCDSRAFQMLTCPSAL